MSIYDSLPGASKPANETIPGVCVGVVTNNKDPEKLGRVKVKLPIRECQNEAYWARVATLMAGNNMGCFFLPEVNDEVLVAFSEGDVRQPYIIGMLWNAKDKPPETNEDGKNNIRKIKSRSGHELIFTDENGKEKLEIITKGGHNIAMDDQSGKIEIKEKGGKGSIAIDGNQLHLKNDMKINIQSNQGTIVIDTAGIKIESKMQLQIKGQILKIEAGGMMEIKSGGILTIQGALVKIG